MFESIKNKKNLLGVELVNAGVITQAQLDEAIAYQRNHPELRIGEIIDTLNLCDKTRLLEVLSEKLQIKAVVIDESIDLDYTQLLSRDTVINYKALPFQLNGNTVKVAFANPEDSKAVESVKLQLLNLGLEMEKYLTLTSMIMDKVKTVKNVQDKYVDTNEKDTTILVDNIVYTAIKQRASDIHIEPLENKVRIRYRIDGELVTVSELPKQRQAMIAGRIKSIANMHQEITSDQDGSIDSFENYSIVYLHKRI